MGFLSQSGHFTMKKQTVPGTYESTTGTAGVAFRLRSGSLEANRDLLIPDPEIGGSRAEADAYLGAVRWGGDIDLYARFKHIATIISAAFGGTPVITTTTGVSTVTMSPGDTLPLYSIEEAVGNGFDVFQYTDAKVNTLHFEADANGYVMATMGIIARIQTAGNTSNDPVAITDISPLGVGTNISVTYNAVTLPAKNFKLDLNNNIDEDDYRLGSFFLGDLTEKRRELTMGVLVRPSSSALWRQAVYGLPGATAVGGIPTKQQAVITISSYEDIPAGTPATKYSMSFTIPSAIITPLGVQPSGDDIIEHDFEIRALQPNPATPVITAVVKTNQATVI